MREKIVFDDKIAKMCIECISIQGGNMRTAAINLRAMPNQRDLIDYAASILGKTRSDFMLETACQAAQNVILDRTVFQLNEQAFTAFEQLLAEPTEHNERLENLLNSKSVWE